MKAVKTENLTKYYGKHRGVIRLNLSVEQGDFFGFIGPNGAGKSTTIRLLLGLISPTEGNAEILGKCIKTNSTEVLRDLGYLPSEAFFYKGLRVKELLRLSADLRGLNCEKEAAELCERLSNVASAEEGAPVADRLERIVESEPIMRMWAEGPLVAHYLEIGAVERIKNLLDLLRHGKKSLVSRLDAKLRPTDDICAEPLTESERADIAQVLAGHSVKEVYAVRRIYEGTGIHTSFLVIRWRTLANPGPLLVAFNDAFEDYSVVSGTRSLFKCFAELGVSPIPVPRKASHESSTGS